MDPNSNPYASPTLPKAIVAAEILSDDDLSGECPDLPLEFRCSLMTLQLTVPIGIATLTICAFAIASLSMATPDNADPLMAIMAAVLSGITAYGCLMSLRCKIIATESSIEVIDVGRKQIYFSQISSWHHHPGSGTVMVSLFENLELIPVSNWAMSLKKSKLLGQVLRAKVGPPSGSKVA